MRRFLCVLAVMALLVCGLPAGSAGDDGTGRNGPPASGRDEVSPDGWYWCNDRRLTDSGAEDKDPVPAVDPDGLSGIVWTRGNNLMWKKVDRLGNELVAEKLLGYYNVPVQECGFVSTCIAADSNGSFHIVAESGGSGAYYARMDGKGDITCPVGDVSPGANNPGDPSIAVTPDGNVSVTLEDDRWSYDYRAVTCIRRHNDGTYDKGPVRMSEAGWDCVGSTSAVDRDGYLHAAFLTSSLEIYHAILDPDGEPLPGVPPAFLYKTDSLLADGPPSIACDDSGAVHVVWNDNPQRIGTMRYMTLDRFGNKLVAGADGNGIVLTSRATCKGFPSIVARGAGGASVFWSDVRNGNAQVWQLSLSTDDLNDSGLPDRGFCLTKDTAGSALEPKAALDPDNNLHVVWKDNRDGNYEIYYKFGYNPGINLTMGESEKGNFLEIHPNHVRSGNVTLRNPGVNDTAELGLEVDFLGHPGGTGENYTGDGWKIWFSAPGPSVDVDYLETLNVTLNIRGPAAGAANDHIGVTVNATTGRGGPTVQRVSFRAYLVMNHSFEHMGITDHVHSGYGGETNVFSLFIENGGGFDEMIELSAECTPGWEWEILKTRIHLDPHGGCDVTVNLTPPLDAAGDEVGTVTITARFAEEPTVFRTTYARMVISPFMELSIWPDRTDGRVAPGNSTGYVITVGMVGNIRTPTPVLVEASGAKEGWSISLDPSAVSLVADESASVVLSVTAPAEALAGDALKVNVSCHDVGANVIASCAVTTAVGQVFGFNVAVAPPNATVLPGGNALFRFDVTNEGNGPDRFRPEALEAPEGWKVSLLDKTVGEDIEAEGILLAAGETGWFKAVVSSPVTAMTGGYDFTVRVRDGAMNARQAGFVVEVEQVFGVELRSDAPALSGDTGARVIFPLTLRNAGNGPDVLRLNASALPDGWAAAEFRDGNNVLGDKLELNASATGQMAVAVVIPQFTRLDELRFNVTASSASGPDSTIRLALTIKKADLVILGVGYPSKDLRVARPFFVCVTVQNRGDATAANVSVAYYRNGVLRTTESLGRMIPGENRTVTFVWVPVEGKNVLRFVADPKDEVCEKNETDNGMTVEKRLHTEKVTILSDESWMIMAAAIPAIAIGLVLLTYASWRRRRL